MWSKFAFLLKSGLILHCVTTFTSNLTSVGPIQNSLVYSVAEYFIMYILEKFSYNNTLVLGKMTLFCNKFQTCAVWFAPLA